MNTDASSPTARANPDASPSPAPRGQAPQSTAEAHFRERQPPTAADLAALQALIDRSTRTATASVADSLAYPARQMTAAELVDFWWSVRLVAMATVGPHAQPHIAPVHAEIEGTTLRVVIYEDAVRRRDLVGNSRVAFTAWGADGAAAILYGRAREVEDSLRDARPGQSGKSRRVVTIDVALTRVYAMRGRERKEVAERADATTSGGRKAGT
jgi:hypothetical protein